MKTKLICCVLFVLPIALLGSASAQNSRQPSAASVNEAARSLNPTLCVTITAEDWNGEVVSYKSGKKLVVVVPQARAEAITWNLVGQGLAGVQIEQRGDDSVVILQVHSSDKPAVSQHGNSIEVMFPVGGVS